MRIIDCMPIRDQTVDVVRIVEGAARPCADAMDLTIRFDYGADHPLGPQHRRRAAWPSPARTRSCCAHRSSTRGRRALDRRRVHRPSRRSECRSVLAWYPSHQEPLPGPRNAAWSLESNRRGGAAGRRSGRYDGEWPEARAAVGHHAEGAHVRADGRDRRRPDDVAPRVDRQRPQLGLPVLLASRRDVHASRPHPRRIRGGGEGVAAVAAARHRRRARRPADHVRPRRRAPADRVGGSLAARLRGLEAGAGRQRRVGAVPARRVRRGHRPLTRAVTGPSPTATPTPST